MSSRWEPVHEPLGVTLRRTVSVALGVGLVLSLARGTLLMWPLASLIVLWFSLGGHWVEIWFLNWLRPRLPAARAAQVGMRFLVWFVGGVGLAAGMVLTAALLGGLRREGWPAWYWGGLAFIGVELVAHVLLVLRGQPSFFDGRA